MKTLRVLSLLFAAVAIAGCGVFGGKKDPELEPAELVDFDPQIRVNRLWTANLGGDAENLRLALRPSTDGSRIFAASQNGKVYAFDPENGDRQWETKLDLELSAGPGIGEGLAVVVSSDGMVVALDAASGTERWRVDIGGESLATPLITDDTVLVQTVDNRMRALASFDGSSRWSVLQSMPALTMRGSASPIVVGSSVIAGFDNGRLIAVGVEDGETRWETLIAPPSGRSDLDRLSDVDGAIAAVGQDVYAAGYQGRLGSIAAESGQVLWARDISTFEGVAADWTSLYTVQEGGVVIALSRRNGTETWRQETLLRREPTLPVPFYTTVATGDFEGYVHFFSNVDGDLVARVRVGKSAITADPVVVGNRLYVQNDGGLLAVYEVEQPERPPNRAPDISDEGV